MTPILKKQGLDANLFLKEISDQSQISHFFIIVFKDAREGSSSSTAVSSVRKQLT